MLVDSGAWAQFEAIFETNPSAVQEVVAIYLAESEKLGRRIQEALDAGDASALHQAAHSLKSTSRQLGGLRLGDLCQQLEDAGRSGDLDAAHAIRPRFERDLVDTRAELERRLRL